MRQADVEGVVDGVVDGRAGVERSEPARLRREERGLEVEDETVQLAVTRRQPAGDHAVLVWLEEHTGNRRRRRRALGELTPVQPELAFPLLEGPPVLGRTRAGPSETSASSGRSGQRLREGGALTAHPRRQPGVDVVGRRGVTDRLGVDEVAQP